MSYSTWTPPVEPSAGSARKPKYNRQEAKFGDGYTQRTHVGINPRGETLDLVWNVLSTTDADTIENWFESYSALGTGFYYTPPNDTDGPPVPLWTVSEWTRTEIEPLASSITATLTRVYDL